jgi:hypothetical protein
MRGVCNPGFALHILEIAASTKKVVGVMGVFGVGGWICFVEIFHPGVFDQYFGGNHLTIGTPPATHHDWGDELCKTRYFAVAPIVEVICSDCGHILITITSMCNYNVYIFSFLKF